MRVFRWKLVRMATAIGITVLFLRLLAQAQEREGNARAWSQLQTFSSGISVTGNSTFANSNKILAVDGVQYTTLTAAVAACTSPRTVIWVPDGTNPTLSSVLTIANPCHLIFGKNTITCAMADPGTSSGCINVTSDNVEIEGQGAPTLITQGNAANIQTAIFLGAHGNVKIHGLKLDWNDANQTASASTYAGIRSSAGAHDVRIYDNEFTHGGDRAIDLRGTSRVWILRNYFHQTGLNVAGVTNRGGNSVSVDVAGTPSFNACWLEDNIVEEQGDAFACAHGTNIHVSHNTIRGRADFGNTPMNVEAGIDVSGGNGVEVIGNHLFNVRGPSIYAQSLTVGGVTYLTLNNQIEGNVIYVTASSLASSDPRVDLGNESGLTGQLYNDSFIGNSMYGARLNLAGVDGAVVKGNTFHNIMSNLTGIAVNVDQLGSSTMRNFAITDNTASTDNATLTTFLSLSRNVTTPDSCTIGNNATSASVTNDVTAIAEFSTSTCLITRSNKTIGTPRVRRN